MTKVLPATPVVLSSGDLMADRRYAFARELAARGDVPAAADLLVQALELTPRFVPAWFALGEVREALGDRKGAVAAFREALACDPDDRHGAALRLARLNALDPSRAMSPKYVQSVFDQYALRFDRELTENLNYCAPALLRRALMEARQRQGRPPRFRRALDLGCGTGLMGQAMRDLCATLVGVDLSPAMIEQARRKDLYQQLVIGDFNEFLGRDDVQGFDLVVAADALVYVADLQAVFGGVARALEPEGLFAFTLETHEGEGSILGEKLRYAHAASYVDQEAACAGLSLLTLAQGSSRTESGIPVPGLVVVTQRR